MEGDPEIDGMPFSKLMDQAVKLRTHTHAHLRSKFDKWPRWYQNSMFDRPELQKERELPFQDRVQAFISRKEQAEKWLVKKDPLQAANDFETALAIFKYIHNTHPGWKKKGIYDEHIQERDNMGTSTEEREQAACLMADVLLRLADLYGGPLGERAAALGACGSAVGLTAPFLPAGAAAAAAAAAHARALHRRAEVRVGHASAGATEHDLALRDLRAARRADPANAAARDLLQKLQADRKRQMERDKKTFAGLFGRGAVVTPEEEARAAALKREARRAQEEQEQQAAAAAAAQAGGPPGAGAGAAAAARFEGPGEDLRAHIRACEDLARQCKKEGRADDYEALKKHLKAAKQELKRRRAGGGGGGGGDGGGGDAGAGAPPPDFRNPTPEMIEDARRQGIDLTDPQVVGMLEQMQRETEGKQRPIFDSADEKNKAQAGGGGGGGGGGAGAFEPSPSLVAQTLRAMPPGDVRRMLVAEGGLPAERLATLSDAECVELAIEMYAKEQQEGKQSRPGSKTRQQHGLPRKTWVLSFTLAGLANPPTQKLAHPPLQHFSTVCTQVGYYLA